MTSREQWKALRAPVIRELWITRGLLLKYLAAPEPITLGTNVSFYYKAARQSFLALYGESRQNLLLGENLNLLTAMRQAERDGENALLWKLSR